MALCGPCRYLHSPANYFHDLAVGFSGGASGVDDGDPLRFAFGDCTIGLMDPGEEGAVLFLEAIFVCVGLAVFRGRVTVAAASALDAYGDVGVHQYGEIGMQVSAENLMKLEYWMAAQLASAALISFGRVGEAVAQNDLAFGQRRFDDFVDMLRASGEHEREFGMRGQRPGAGIEKKLANFLGGGRASGFASDDDREFLGAELGGELF